MCGIAGFSGLGDRGTLLAMMDTLRFRGPDGSGLFVDAEHRIFFGHRRLAILDAQGGKQPMWNEDHDVCVVFNGEIYNHAELRSELATLGHRFSSHHSDTEVLVHGYEEWGEELPGRLNGMFAFAVYDQRRQRLFLARDRFGKKPLYYAQMPGLFAFASEMTALRCHPGIPAEVDLLSLQKYFAYGYIPAPNALYKAVHKLPGGHWLRLDIQRRATVIRPYWRFSIELADTIARRGELDLAEELRALLQQAVKRRLISDVPLGFFLSGGIDSSIVVAAAAQFMPATNIKTFSIGFLEPSFDESAFSRCVAGRFATDHHEEILSMETARELSREVLSRLDEPMADGSLLPTYLLCRFARHHVTVALGGEGGDELFAGYDPFHALRPASWYRRLVPQRVHRGLRRLCDALPLSDRNMSLDFKVKRTLRGLQFPPMLWNPVWMSLLEPAEIAELLMMPVTVEALYSEAIDAWQKSKADNLLDRSLEFYTNFYLQDDILAKVDRASMMVSLEVRAPFLDNDVVEFARLLPRSFKLRHGQSKYLLKKAFGCTLPNEILHRKKKGFGIPLAAWMRTWAQPESAGQAPPYNAGWVNRVWSAHQRGMVDQRLFMWGWLVLHRHFAPMAV